MPVWARQQLLEQELNLEEFPKPRGMLSSTKIYKVLKEISRLVLMLPKTESIELDLIAM